MHTVIVILPLCSPLPAPGPVSILEIIERFTSITVLWKEPVEPNGVISNYDIIYNVTGGEPEAIERIRPVDTELSQLIPMSGMLPTGQALTIAVRAYTRIGPGPSSTFNAITRDRPRELNSY